MPAHKLHTLISFKLSFLSLLESRDAWDTGDSASLMSLSGILPLSQFPGHGITASLAFAHNRRYLPCVRLKHLHYSSETKYQVSVPQLQVAARVLKTGAWRRSVYKAI
jgi:hypothetical protein